MKIFTYFFIFTLLAFSTFTHAGRSKAEVDQAYASIKSIYKVAVDNSKGTLTWKDWDKFKGPLYKILSNQNLNTNQLLAALQQEFSKAGGNNNLPTPLLQPVLQKLIQTPPQKTKPQTSSIDADYTKIKANFKTAVDASRGSLTWNHWDNFKKPLHKTLSNQALTANQKWSTIKKDFGKATADKAWKSWDIVTGKSKSHGKLNDLYALLQKLPSTTARLPNYLYDRQAIQKAVASPSQGKGKVIPYFGYWNPTDIKNRTNNNGFWYLSNYFVSDPKLKMDVTVRLSYKGRVYSFNNVEAAYQAGKCLISGFISTPAQINEFVHATPDQSKYLANTKYKFKFKITKASKIDAMMRSLVRQKFINGPLGKKLVNETGETTLIEGNAWDDAIWGAPFDGVKHVPAKAGIMKGKQGQNKLGKLLVDIRKEIKSGKAKKNSAFSI